MEILHNNSSIETEQETHDKRKKNLDPMQRNLLISCALIGLIVVLLFGWFTFRPDNKADIHDYFSAEMVGELTTLQCRYHNVSVYDNEGGFLGIGKQYVWFEYDVIVDLGIDVKQVKIEGPSEEGMIKIFLPPIEVFGAKPDLKTIKKPVHDVALGADLTTAEELKIIYDGVDRLMADAKTDEIISLAQKSAKDVLEKYVMNIGTLLGEDYKVEWVDIPNDIQNETTSQNEAITQTESTPE